MSLAPVDRVLARLRERGHEPRRAGAGWSSTCPAHDDRSPSLSIGIGDTGDAVVHCHAGCPLDLVMGALGLAKRDLFHDGQKSSAQARKATRATRSFATWEAAAESVSRGRGKPAMTWEYHDAQGVVVGVVCRWNLPGGKKDINGRHMAQTAAHLVDHVIPTVPVRQWVISVPKRLRGFLADRPRDRRRSHEDLPCRDRADCSALPQA
jgi:hypothetical protein